MADDTLTAQANGATTRSDDGAGATSAAIAIAGDPSLTLAAGPSAVEIAEAITASAAGLPAVPPAAAPPIVDKLPMGAAQRGVIGGSLVFVTGLIMTQLLAIWPGVVAATTVVPDAQPRAVSTPLLFGAAHMTFDPQVVLILMVLLIGALGALVGSSRRFLYFATRDELTKRDEWSYLIRPLQGAAL
jgi:hypothetical protein